MGAEEQGRRPDRPGQEESSNRLDGETARRRSSSPAGEPRCQRPTLEDQHPAPDGERQPSAAEQRAASQTLPPLHSPPIPTSPHTPLSTVLSPPETADLTCVPQQQEQGKSTMPQASSNPGLSSKDLTPWGRAPALTVVCAALLALSPKQQSPTNPSPSPSPSPPLPLKKTYPPVGLSLNTD